jgi:hypothetical protein
MAQWFVTNILLQTLYNICINMVKFSEQSEDNAISSPNKHCNIDQKDKGT